MSGKLSGFVFALIWIVLILLALLITSCSSRKPVPGKGRNQEIHHIRKHRNPFFHRSDTTQWLRYELEEMLFCGNPRV